MNIKLTNNNGESTVLFFDANSYSNNSKFQHEASLEFIKQFKFRGNETVLDIGCGDGRITSLIADQLPHGKVVGIDNSPNMIDFAAEKNKRNNLTFEVMDAQKIKFPYKFDVIVSTFCFHWIKDKQSALNTIRAHITTNGKLLFIIPLQNPITAKIRHELINSTNWQQYYVDYDDPSETARDAAYDDYAIKSGFSNVVMRKESMATTFNDRDELFLFLKNITPCIKVLPNEKLQNEFMNDYISEYLTKRTNPDESKYCVTYDYVTLTALAGDVSAY